MKKAWKEPQLQDLLVKETMASTIIGPFTDEAYDPGTPADPDNPGTWKRFTS